MLNKALELEYAARIQYLAHVGGIDKGFTIINKKVVLEGICKGCGGGR